MGRRLTGIGVSPGIASGPVERLTPAPPVPDAVVGGDADGESRAASSALMAAAADLESRGRRATGPAADILSAQAMMAGDPVLRRRIEELVSDGRSASGAVVSAFDEFRAQLREAGAYLAARAADLDSVRDRVLALVLGQPMPGIPDPGHPFVLVARELSPADTAGLDPTHVLAVITELGGLTSHTAIISKSLGIPAVMGCLDSRDLAAGDRVSVDGGAGIVIVDPDDASFGVSPQARSKQFSGPGRTADGSPVQLLVNLGAERDLGPLAAIDAEGVGLYRTEFLFLGRLDQPTLEEQRGAYARAFAAFRGRKVVVRTLDAGADKPLRFVDHPAEANPALGLRGLRVSRRFPDLLDRQLRALAHAAAEGSAEVWVMAPMVATAAEAAAFADLAHGHGLVHAGAMVEVPAAALQAHGLAAACDFLSIGTNDLAQYTFAADRTSSELADLLDPWQPALLELVRLTAGAGQSIGRPVGVCGEAASDPALALVLAGLGITSLSMAGASLPEVRRALAEHSLAECQRLAALALGAPDGRAGHDAVRRGSRLE